MKIKFTELTKATEAQAKNIIIEGLKEHWGTYDPIFNPDLNALLITYGKNCITAWVDNLMIGTGSWYRKDENTAFICRMSVIPNFRRTRFGSLMLSEIEKRIKMHHLSYVELETTSNWKGVMNFYLKNGYRITHETGGDTYFFKDLTS